MDRVYCAILSKSRLYQFLALHVSLQQVMDENYQLYVLCVEDEAYNLLKKLNLKNINLFHEKELSEYILSLKDQRKMHEYCWTLKAILLETVLNKHPDIQRVTYMDSDLFFWKNPEILFEKQPNCSVLLTREEKYNPAWKSVFIKKLTEITGNYNSGFISFKRDEVGVSCLRWWKEQSVECCKIAPKEGKFGDQRYLNEMPVRFSGVCEITTPGVNIGPWDYLKYNFHLDEDQVMINQVPLIFYHFSGVRVVHENGVRLVHNSRENTPFIYTIYKEVLNRVIKMVELIEPGFNGYATKDDLKSYW